jgi:hypothetical protein
LIIFVYPPPTLMDVANDGLGTRMDVHVFDGHPLLAGPPLPC